MTTITPCHTNEYERPIIEVDVWRGVRNAIIPSLLFWASFAALGWYLAGLV